MNTVSHSKLFSAYRTLDTLTVDAPHLSGRNQPSTFRAYRIERRLHLFEIDLPGAWHDLGYSRLEWVGGRFFVQFAIYLDDSGTSPSQPVACATGLIVPVRRILHMESEWVTLKQQEGFSDFHASEFVARNHKSEFAKWDDAKHTRVFRRVRQITKKYGIQIFSFSVKKDDYEQCVPHELRQYAGEFHYTWAIRHVTQFAQQWRVDKKVSEPYHWVFDWMEPRDPARKEIVTVMEQSEEQARSQRGVRHEYTRYDFHPRGASAALQCADLVAWTNYNFSLFKWRNKPVHRFASIAWDDFASMPSGYSPNIHEDMEWNFSVVLKRDDLEDWAKRELADGRSLVRFREFEARKKMRQGV